MLDLAKRSETAIYAIGLRQGEIARREFKEAEFVLKQLAHETGGRAFFVTDARELPKIYQAISDELSSQYTIAYSSRNPKRDGAWRRVRSACCARTRPRDQAGLLRPDGIVTVSRDGHRRWLPFVLVRRGRGRLPRTLLAPRSARPAAPRRRCSAAAVLAHTFLIGMQTMEAGYAPLVGTTAAVSAFVWLLGLAYLYVELTTDERAMGVFVTHAARRARHPAGARPADASSARRCCAARCSRSTCCRCCFAYASFALAFVLGITYVLLFKEIKAKHLGFFYTRLPSLQMLDVMNGRAIVVGWMFLTCGLVVGGVWATQIHGSPDPRAQAMSVADPKILVALVSWAIYSFALFARRAIGWSGRRAAWLSAIAFVIVLLNFVPVGYFLTRSHNF